MNLLSEKKFLELRLVYSQEIFKDVNVNVFSKFLDSTYPKLKRTISRMEKKFYANLNDYEKQELIGKGAFGEVYILKNKKSKDIYAGKICINTMKEGSHEATNLKREIKIISQTDHPTIIKFIGFSPINFQKEAKPVIITEYLPNGSLDKIIDSTINSLAPEQWDDTKKLITLYGIASGMAFLHSNDVLHRDLKPANILMDQYLHPKICDFGLSKEENKGTQSTISFKGTPAYSAPEVIEECSYSKMSDVYSFGIITYELICNERPFSDKEKLFRLQTKIINGERPKFNSPIGAAYKELIESCWHQRTNERPSFEEIKEALRTDPGFITDLVDEGEFLSYVDFIDNQNASYNPGPPIDLFRPLTGEKVVEDEEEDEDKDKDVLAVDEVPLDFPPAIYKRLSKKNKMLVNKALKENDPSAQYNVGLNLMNGSRNFPKNFKLGLKYLKLSVDNDCIDAVKNYCRKIIDGNMIPKNLVEAREILENHVDDDENDPVIYLLFGLLCEKEKNLDQSKKYLTKAAKRGVSEAMYELGMLYFKEKNNNKAKEYFDKAQKNGFRKKPPQIFEKPADLHKKGINYLSGKNGKSNIPQAIWCFKAAADQNYVPSMVELGKIYYNGAGNGVQKNYKKAFKLFKAAADQGNSLSIRKCAYMNYKGLGTPLNLEEAAKYYKIGADNDDVKSILNYSLMLKNGEGVQRNLQKAMKYLKKGVQQGNEDCRDELREIQRYIRRKEEEENNDNDDDDDDDDIDEDIDDLDDDEAFDEGLQCLASKNFRRARALFKKAADSGNTRAMINYANLLQNGKGGPQNEQKATLYYRKAAEGGNPNGMLTYGLMLEHGTGIRANVKQAARFYKMAADNGQVKGMLNYGRLLQNGIGVAKNEKQALKYYRMAANAGETKGETASLVLEKELKRRGENVDDDEENDFYDSDDDDD